MVKKSIIALFALFIANAHAEGFGIVVVEGHVTLNLLVGNNETSISEFSMGEFFTLPKNGSIQARGGEADCCVTDSSKKQVCITLEKDKIDTDFVREKLSTSTRESLVLALEKFFTYEAESFQGGKRLDDKESLTGFPTGSVLKPESALFITLQEKNKNTYSDFSLYNLKSQTPSFHTAKISKVIKIPSAYLQYGGEYRWQIKQNGKVFKGEFVVAYEDDQQAFEQELQSTPDYNTLSAGTKLLLRAIKAKEWQYSYDMDAAAKQLIATAEIGK